MHADAGQRPAIAPNHGDVDVAGSVRECHETPCRVGAQEGTRPAGEDRGGLVSERMNRPVPDEVDAGVDGNQATGVDAPLNHPMGESRTEEPLTSDDPPLPPCELGQNRIEFSRWSTYTVL